MKRIFSNHTLCSGCRACSIACSIAHTGYADDFRGAIRILRNPVEGYEFQSVCRVCENPDCVSACMGTALSRNPETGKIHFNVDRCVGCWMCVMVCPYNGIFPDYKSGKAIICDQCEDRDTPACVAACSTSALAFAEADREAVVKG